MLRNNFPSRSQRYCLQLYLLIVAFSFETVFFHEVANEAGELSICEVGVRSVDRNADMGKVYSLTEIVSI